MMFYRFQRGWWELNQTDWGNGFKGTWKGEPFEIANHEDKNYLVAQFRNRNVPIYDIKDEAQHIACDWVVGESIAINHDNIHGNVFVYKRKGNIRFVKGSVGVYNDKK